MYLYRLDNGTSFRSPGFLSLLGEMCCRFPTFEIHPQRTSRSVIGAVSLIHSTAYLSTTATCSEHRSNKGES
jgi:hypothetical protein